MNRIEFYTKLNKAKDEVRKKQLEHSSTQNNYNSWFIKVDDYYGINQPRYFTKEEFDELRHSNEYGKQHYAKIENYYPDGRTRYFWTKDEWEAYQRNKGQDEYRKKQQQNKTVEQKSNMTNYSSWEKEQKEKEQKEKEQLEEAKRQKIVGVGNTREEKLRNRSYFDKNKAAENEYEKQKWDALKKQNNQEPEKSTAKTREEAEIEARNKTVENNRKKKLEKDFENWKKEGEKNILPSRKKLNQYTEELTKLQGQMNLIKNRKFSQEGDKKRFYELEKAIDEKEHQIKKAKESLAKEREANYKKNMASQEKAIKEGQKTTIEENRKLKESIEKQKEEELNNWKDEKKTEVDNELNKIYSAILNINNGNNKSLGIDNEYVDLLKEMISDKDPDFNGDLDKYITPVDNNNWFLEAAGLLGINSAASVAVKTLDDAHNLQEKHIELVKNIWKELKSMIKSDIDSTTYEDEKYDSYLNKLKKQKKEKTDKAITKDISTARLSLKKMYDGDSKKLDLDSSLMKALNSKLRQIDENYNGSLYKYVRPYLFNTWIKDEESYETVKKALDEIEAELRVANKNDKNYGKYIDKVSKILEA